MAEEDLGEDFAGALDIDPSLSVVSGRRAHAEAVARRWYDRAGSLFYDRNYGAGIETYLNAAVPPDTISAQLEQEALKDERTEDCTVAVTRGQESLRIDGRLVDADGPFGLTVLASQLDVEVLLEGIT